MKELSDSPKPDPKTCLTQIIDPDDAGHSTTRL